jgi:hypothetical protein
MKMKYEKSIEYQMVKLIEKMPGRVLLRKDVSHLGGYRQISRALKKLVDKKQLVKIGFGVYAKAYQSSYLDEPLLEEGFDVVCREALDRLNIAWEPGSAELAYNAGKSQQVPVQNIVRLKNRCRRTIAYMNQQLSFEGKVNAR